MRKTLFAAAACATVLWTGCSKSESVTVIIANPLAIERTGNGRNSRKRYLYAVKSF